MKPTIVYLKLMHCYMSIVFQFKKRKKYKTSPWARPHQESACWLLAVPRGSDYRFNQRTLRKQGTQKSLSKHQHSEDNFTQDKK